MVIFNVDDVAGKKLEELGGSQGQELALVLLAELAGDLNRAELIQGKRQDCLLEAVLVLEEKARRKEKLIKGEGEGT